MEEKCETTIGLPNRVKERLDNYKLAKEESYWRVIDRLLNKIEEKE